MSNYTNSLNELINTKKEIKDIIIESTGENPSEVFSYYPSYIRSAISSGGGSASEEEVNSYISAYLSTYNFINQDTLSSNSYLTSHQDLSSYATKSYVVDYVATYAPTPDLSSYVTKTELSAQSYLTSIPSEYITQNELSANSYITANDIPIESANGVSSFSLKNSTSLVTGDYSVSLGRVISVSGSYNVAEGSHNYINGENSHVEGLYNSILGADDGGDYNEQFKHHCSHVEGIGNVSTYCGSHVEGTYNFPYIVQYLRGETGYSFILNNEAFISTIGVGTGGNLNNAFNVDETKAKNAVAVTNSGKVYIFGVGDYNGTYVFSYQGWATENSASIKSLQEVIDELPSYSYLYSYVGEALSNIPTSPDLSSYVTKTELSNQSYLTSIPSEYITQNELSSCGYITMGDVSSCGYITLADVPGTDLSNYVTYSYAYNTFVSYSYLGDIEEITEYILGSGSSSAPENIYATKTELGAYVSKTSLESMSYITMDDIDACGYITNSVTELEGPLFISRPDAGNGTYGFCSYTHIVAGTQDKTTVSFLASKRKCGGAEGSAYMSAFFVNSDGRSKFTHKSYTNKADVGLEADDAFLCFNAYGFKLSYSGTPGTAASTEYDLIHSGNINNYIPSSAVIDENIIPKENNTYTLGDSSYLYATSYITDMWLGAKNKFSNRSDNQVNLMLNNGWKYTFHSNGLSPANDNNQNLGSSTSKWKASYSYNYYFGYNTAISSDSDYGVQLTINGNKNYQWNMYQFTMTNNNYRNQCSLGTSGNQWAYTYTNNLILNGVNATEVFPSYAYINNVLGDIETLLSNI